MTRTPQCYSEVEVPMSGRDLWVTRLALEQLLANSTRHEHKAAVMAEAGASYATLVAAMPSGPASAEAQAMLEQRHQNMRHFFEPSIETLRGLGEAYHDHPGFNATFTAMDPALPAFLKAAIAVYVDTLETRWLEQELGILKE